MILYRLVAGHIPMTTNDIIKPCVPNNRLYDEDDKIPRICVSKTLDGCLTSLGPAAVGLAALLREMQATKQVGQRYTKQILERLAFPYTIMVFQVPDTAEYLIKNAVVAKYVADAWLTRECWLTQECSPTAILRKWLVHGDVTLDYLLYKQRKHPYYTMKNSVWSETQKTASKQLKDQVLIATQKVLTQEGKL